MIKSSNVDLVDINMFLDTLNINNDSFTSSNQGIVGKGEGVMTSCEREIRYKESKR